MCYKVAISLRLEFHEAWKHSFKAQLLVWNAVLLFRYFAVKEWDQAKSWDLKPCFQAWWNPSLRLEFHKAWKHGFKPQLLVWDTVLLHKICTVKKLDQTKNCALKLCFQASWNSSVKLEFHQDWKHGHGFKSQLLVWNCFTAKVFYSELVWSD